MKNVDNGDVHYLSTNLDIHMFLGCLFGGTGAFGFLPFCCRGDHWSPVFMQMLLYTHTGRRGRRPLQNAGGASPSPTAKEHPARPTPSSSNEHPLGILRFTKAPLKNDGKGMRREGSRGAYHICSYLVKKLLYTHAGRRGRRPLQNAGGYGILPYDEKITFICRDSTQ